MAGDLAPDFTHQRENTFVAYFLSSVTVKLLLSGALRRGLPVIAQQPVSPEPGDASQTVQASSLPLATEATTPIADDLARPGARTVGAVVGMGALAGVKALALAALVVLVALGIAAGGLNIVPMIGAQTAEAVGPPHPNPVLPPAVPIGARADWAEWTYVQQINQVWGKDWPKVIAWFEELNARYPGNPMVFDKLYAAEQGK